MTSRTILVGVDGNLSPPTQAALEHVCRLLGEVSSTCHLILLHVIPVPLDPTPKWGEMVGSWSYYAPTGTQIQQAQHALRQARTFLGQRGIPFASIELLTRVGTPADELNLVARERAVDLLVLGSHPPSPISFIWNLLCGSTSRRLVRLASCQVLLAYPASLIAPGDLVSQYEQALQLCLHQQTGTLLVFTPTDVARRYAPTEQAIGPHEIAAAAQALKRLAKRGLMLCQEVQGEMRCWND